MRRTLVIAAITLGIAVSALAQTKQSGSYFGFRTAIGLQNVDPWTAQDANEGWTMPAASGWYGGSYYQILDKVSKMERDTDSRSVFAAKVLRQLSREARQVDAALMHVERSADKSHGDLSILTIQTLLGYEAFPAFAALKEPFWIRWGQHLLSTTNGAHDVTLIRHREDLIIRGNQVGAAGFKITAADSSKRYRGLILIYRSAGITVINLDAPWHVADSRLEETWTMVRAIEFRK